MLVLTTTAGGEGEQVSLLSQQGDAVGCSLVSPSALAASVPLTSAFWVDVNSTTPGTPNGSAANPFKSLQEACDACTVLGSVIYLCNLGGSPLVVDLTVSKPGITIIGQCNPAGTIAPITIAGPVVVNAASFGLQNIVLTNGIDASSGDGGDITLIDSSVAGDILCNSLTATAQLPGVHGVGNVTSAGGVVQLVNVSSSGTTSSAFQLEFTSTSDPESPQQCNVGAWTLTQGCYIQNGLIQSNITAQFFEIEGAAFGLSVTLASTAAPSAGFSVFKVHKSTKPTAATVVTFTCTGELNELEVDQFSNQWMNNSVHTELERVRVIGALPQISIAVAVPGVSAGDVAYVDVDVSATDLQGITTGSFVDANPTDDLVAAGAGGGYINCRVSALNTVRFAFLGPLSGASHNFLIALLSRANVSP